MNAFSYPAYPVVTASDEIQVFNWGLIPFWTKITTKVNQLTEYIHNTRHRMSVILQREDKYEWLKPDLTLTDITSLPAPFDAKKMDAYNFLKKNPKDPAILKRTK